ncbi:hypothetical protein [Spartinivicinus ruber]|uniref:hypothetical protein n=1 Tax=Spartinivicinus ruber TaxID=2683272 RepID=UPI0013D44095|nr:hypothetical protein [Spartinivicinus ruber]
MFYKFRILVLAICVLFLSVFANAANSSRLISTTLLSKSNLEKSEKTLKVFKMRPPYFELTGLKHDHIVQNFSGLVESNKVDFLEDQKYHVQLFGSSRWFIGKKVVAIAVCDSYVQKLIMLGFGKTPKEVLSKPRLVFDGQGCFLYAFYNMEGELIEVLN